MAEQRYQAVLAVIAGLSGPTRHAIVGRIAYALGSPGSTRTSSPSWLGHKRVHHCEQKARRGGYCVYDPDGVPGLHQHQLGQVRGRRGFDRERPTSER